MKTTDCFNRGLLHRVPIEQERVRSALSLAAHYLERAEGNLKIKYADVTFLMAYTSMLQSASAFLFFEGVKERSHVCAVQYVREKLGSDEAFGPFVELLDTYRQNRHETQYDGAAVSLEDARQIVADANSFLALVKKRVS